MNSIGAWRNTSPNCWISYDADLPCSFIYKELIRIPYPCQTCDLPPWVWQHSGMGLAASKSLSRIPPMGSGDISIPLDRVLPQREVGEKTPGSWALKTPRVTCTPCRGWLFVSGVIFCFFLGGIPKKCSNLNWFDGGSCFHCEHRSFWCWFFGCIHAMSISGEF